MRLTYADMHCDTVMCLMEGGSILQNNLHIDLEKLQKGGAAAQCFALFVDLAAFPDPWERALAMEKMFREMLGESDGAIKQAKTAAEIRKNMSEDVISAVLTVEEGGILSGKIERLNTLAEMGVRMITLTWNHKNEIGFPNFTRKDGKTDLFSPNTKEGLTKFGFEAVEMMESLGIIPDASHLSDAGFYDLLKICKKPFVATHSNARSVCGVVRNMTDDMIKKLADKGGIMGLNFCPGFLSEKDKNGSIESVVRHAKHIRNVGGIDALAFGSDFDGIPTHAELPDASHMPKLIEALSQAGFTDAELEKVCLENFLRVLG